MPSVPMDGLINKINNPILHRIMGATPGNEPVYLVGGAIRDALLNRPVYDLDFVIPGNAMKLARQVADQIGAAYFPLDTRRNIARLVFPAGKNKIPEEYFPRRVDFSAFQGKNLEDDLHGRDFTINAMAVEIQQPQVLIDPCGGAADLAKKQLKACSPNSICDDPVRILRAIRFSVELKLNIQSETLKLLRQSINLLSRVSPERLRDELFRILAQSNPSSSIRLLDQLKGLENILPEINALKGVHQSHPHIMDTWEHSLDCLRRLEELLDVLSPEYDPDKSGNLMMGLVSLRLGRFRQHIGDHFNNALNPDRPHRGILNMAALFHDAGKAKTQQADEAGKIRFIGHEQVGGNLAEIRGKALKLSNHENERLVTIIKNHMRPSLLSHNNGIPSQKAIYRFFRDTGDAGVDICILSMADILATYGPTLPQERWASHLDCIRELLSAWWEDRSERVFPTPLLNGDELMEALGLEPGPRVGYLLEAISEAQVSGEVQNRQDALRLVKSLSREK